MSEVAAWLDTLGGAMKKLLHQHRRLVVGAALAATALSIFVLVWFQPHKLLIEQNVNEAVPGAAPSSGRVSPEKRDRGSTPGEPEVIAHGTFQSLEHHTTGDARIIEVAHGSLFLRFEGLDTSNGPDLRVYLSEIAASDDWYAYGERFIDLGALEGNHGNQNYKIPQGTDLNRYKSTVIWCRRFTVGFGVAGLS